MSTRLDPSWSFSGLYLVKDSLAVSRWQWWLAGGRGGGGRGRNLVSCCCCWAPSAWTPGNVCGSCSVVLP